MNVTTLDITRDDAEFTPETLGGSTLHRISIRPCDLAQTRARLAIVHGYGDHAGRYEQFMTWLAGRGGVACHAVDLRGHGRSSGPRAYVNRWDEYLDDLGAFLALAELREPAHLPTFILGHSHGGLVVAVAAIRQRLATSAGCILCAPYFVNAVHVPWYKSVAARLANVCWPTLRLSSGVQVDMCSTDPAMLDDARQDPLLLRCATPRWYLGNVAAQHEAMTHADQFKRPLLVIQGDADPVADPRGAERFVDRAASTDKTLKWYPGFLHEPLREAARERVFADVLEWMAKRFDAAN
jgi:alpha-beta hydrolase superfamily lysophospholipase